MAKFRSGACRLWGAVSLVGALTVAVVEPGPALAQVTTVQGRAFGVFADNLVLLNQAMPDQGPTPVVDLPSAGSATPVTGSAANASVVAGPAQLFSSGPVTVTTQGTTGASGSVTTSSSITNINSSGQEAFTATGLSSTCTASEAGATGSTTVSGGTLFTDSGLAVNNDNDFTDPGEHPPMSVQIPANPAPNTTFEGHIHVGNATDAFRYVFNEQRTNADGSITVNAAHQYLLGPLALGDVIIGQSICGVATAATPSTTTTTTTASTTTSTTAATTSTTSSSSGGVAGGAFGYFTNVGLFGGAPASRGPAPTVTLPAQGSAAPITASDPSASAQYGPAVIFESGRLDVSTQGTTSPRSVKSSSTVLNPGPAPFEAQSAASSCEADASGVRGSTTITSGTVVTRTDRDSNPVTTAAVPANPAPNTEIRGTLDVVGDSFRWVFNEQILGSDGSITVNAAHQYLLGPTARGELIIGQSRCATTAVAFRGPGGQNTTRTAAGDIARTGSRSAGLGAFGLLLVTWGLLGMGLGGHLLATDGHILSLPARRRRQLRRHLRRTARRRARRT